MFMNENTLIVLLFSLLLYSCHTHTAHALISSEKEGYFGEYTIDDDQFGTKTSVKIKGDHRIITTNALPNHSTGEFPNQGNPNRIEAQSRSYVLPINPKYTGTSKIIRETGVAINGVKFEPGTAEVIRCASGESYRVEALQSLIDLGLDDNHAHVQRTGAYHYHGAPTGIIEHVDNTEDLVHVGFAMDGFPIYYSKSGKYRSSYRIVEGLRKGSDCTYRNPHHREDFVIEGTSPNGAFTPDWMYQEGAGDLDECNGILLESGYIYLITDGFPYIGRCLMGEFEEQRRPRGPRPPGRRGE